MPIVERGIRPGALNRTQTTPIATPRSRRPMVARGLTSIPSGKMTPVYAFGLLREDKIDRFNFRLTFEQMETEQVLMNPVNVYVNAYLVPHLAFDRFSGMDELNRSFSGEPNQEGGPVTPYFQYSAAPAVGVNKIHEYMGKHVKQGVLYNTAYVEAYNKIWNFRAINRSPQIPQRMWNDVTLAPAFWEHEQFADVVPIFDQAIIDGEVPLNVIGGKLPVKSDGVLPIKLKYPAGAPTTLNQTLEIRTDRSAGVSSNAPAANAGAQFADVSNVYAELQSNGITVSLSNIELARKTQAFARLRSQFAGLSDEYIIDMLMDGLSIPEQAWKQPILLGQRRTVFGQSKRYASDAANLTESVVNGMTFVDMTVRCPQIAVGGVVMITVEIFPEQLFERQRDPYLMLTSPEQMPHYLRDFLDPEKVEVVRNAQIDNNHATPDGTFGYAPLNWKWSHNGPAIGGKFFRPDATGTNDEDRMRIWAVETANPSLSSDFYIVNNIHNKPFVVTNQDPFEVVVRGEGMVSGLTVFGRPLVESTDDWDEVMEEVDQTRITLPTTTETQAAE